MKNFVFCVEEDGRSRSERRQTGEIYMEVLVRSAGIFSAESKLSTWD